MGKDTIIITMGDPAGVGPEIIRKAFASSSSHDADYEVYGEDFLLDNVPAKVRSFGAITEQEVVPGKISAPCGHASFCYLEAAIKSCLAGDAKAIVTAPLSKEALFLAGHNYPGHTEILAEKSGVKDFVMMLATPAFCVTHVTTHVSVRQALDLISVERIKIVASLTVKAIQYAKGPDAKVAISGLNPHAGENGIMGHEEEAIIKPAIQELNQEGVMVTGPYPPDTVFHRATEGEFDAVVSMLHDHGFLAGKLLNFHQGVNCTLGLPFVRTSVGHGTAFDIAGKDKACPDSLLEAMKMAQFLSGEAA